MTKFRFPFFFVTAFFAALILVGAGCTSDDQAVANQLATGNDPSIPGIENLSEADKNLVMNRFLTPSTKDLNYDILDCPTVQSYDHDVYFGSTVYVWKLKDGKCYPGMQFRELCSADYCACKEPHYHMPLKALDGTVRPNTNPCGSALESDVVATGRVWVSPQQYGELSELFKTESDEDRKLRVHSEDYNE